MVGKVKKLVKSPDYEDRYLVLFSEYALVNIPDVWKGDRNPVKYAAIEDLGIDISKLKWEQMPAPAEAAAAPPGDGKKAGTVVGALTMAEAKKGLALTFGVPPEAIEITIRG